MWDLPGPGIKPLSPLLTGRFLSTIPPGKSSPQIVIEYLFFPGHSLDTSLEYPLDKQSDKNSVTSRNWNMVEIEWRKGSIGFCWKKVCFTSQHRYPLTKSVGRLRQLWDSPATCSLTQACTPWDWAAVTPCLPYESPTLLISRTPIPISTFLNLSWKYTFQETSSQERVVASGYTGYDGMLRGDVFKLKRPDRTLKDSSIWNYQKIFEDIWNTDDKNHNVLNM